MEDVDDVEEKEATLLLPRLPATPPPLMLDGDGMLCMALGLVVFMGEER